MMSDEKRKDRAKLAESELSTEALEDAAGGSELGRDVLVSSAGHDLGGDTSDGDGVRRENLTIAGSTVSGNSADY